MRKELKRGNILYVFNYLEKERTIRQKTMFPGSILESSHLPSNKRRGFLESLFPVKTTFYANNLIEFKKTND